MKNHMKRQHANNQKHECNLCGLAENSMEQIWKHKLDNHTGETSKTNRIDLIAEQNIFLLEELSNLKKNFKDILKQFTYDAEDNANGIKAHVNTQNLQITNAVKVLTKEVITLQKGSPLTPSSSTSSSLKAPKASPTPSSTSAPYVEKTNTFVPNHKPPRKGISRFQSKSRVLIVGDYHTQNLNFRQLEAVTNTTIRTTKSHSDKDAKKEETRDMLEKEHFDHIVFAAPTADIHDLVTMNMNPGDETEALREKVQTSCEHLLKIAENAISEHTKIKDVTIIGHSTRTDSHNLGPFGLVQNLASFANKYMLELRLSSPYKDKLFIVMPGIAAYFEGVRNILSSSSNYNPVENKDDHTHCPQARYMKLNGKKLYSTAVLTGIPPLKTSNRFSPLSQMQGNC